MMCPAMIHWHRFPMQNFKTQRAIVAAARSWVGTPYQHQQMLKGVGVDCVGVILGTGFESGTLTITEEAWAPFANYSRTPNPRKMAIAMKQFLVPVDADSAPRPGLVAWLQWRDDLPMHLGI